MGLVRPGSTLSIPGGRFETRFLVLLLILMTGSATVGRRKMICQARNRTGDETPTTSARSAANGPHHQRNHRARPKHQIRLAYSTASARPFECDTTALSRKKRTSAGSSVSYSSSTSVIQTRWVRSKSPRTSLISPLQKGLARRHRTRRCALSSSSIATSWNVS